MVQTNYISRKIFSNPFSACWLCNICHISRFWVLSLIIGWALVMQMSLSIFCSYKLPLTHSHISSSSKTHQFTKLNVAGILLSVISFVHKLNRHCLHLPMGSAPSREHSLWFSAAAFHRICLISSVPTFYKLSKKNSEVSCRSDSKSVMLIMNINHLKAQQNLNSHVLNDPVNLFVRCTAGNHKN